MATTTLSSALKTGQYVRTLPVYKSAPAEDKGNKSPYTNNQYIAPTGDKNASDRSVSAMVLGAGSGIAPSVAKGDYISNNQTSGITFLVFNRVTSIDEVNLNVGPNNGSGATTIPDGGDSIFIETADHSTFNATIPVEFNKSSIITGDETSPANDNDLIVFGSDQAKDGQDYSFTQGAFSTKLTGFFAPAQTKGLQTPINITDSTVSTGNGNDTLVMANTIISSKITGNTFNMGKGSDLIIFSTPGQTFSKNTVDLGSDTDGDTIVLGGTFTSTGNGSATGSNTLMNNASNGDPTITVKNFNNEDKIYYNGTLYTNSGVDKAALTAATKIQFS